MIQKLRYMAKQAKFILSCVFYFTLIANSTAQSISGLASKADKLFKEDNYTEAMPLYSQLLSLNPRDPFYSYRFGVSMLYSDTRDPNSSIRYIEAGIDKLGKDDAIMLHFHLGTAYHYTFRFIEAIRHYTHFIQLAGNSKKFENYDAHRRIFMCRNGVSLLQDIKDLYVLEKQHVPIENYFRSYNIQDFGGTLIVKPPIFQLRQDKKLKEHSIAFITKDSKTAYFSSYGDKGDNKRDLYKSEKDKDGDWGKPVKLSNLINTPYDEDYPFMLPDGKTLYFSSKGHNSMGGYDVFRTTWDSIANDWTTPINLDFAINTPFDDIMFVTDKEEQFAYFSSNRNSALLHTNVFKVRIDIRPEEAPQEEIAIIADMSADVNDKSYQTAVQIIQEKAKLDVNTSEDDIKKKKDEKRKELFADNYKYNIPDNPNTNDIITITFQHVTEIRNEVEILRNMYATTAIATDNYEQKSKAIEASINNKKQTLNTITNSDDKQTIESEIKALSTEKNQLQTLHNHGLEKLVEIEKTVNKQTKQYNQILFKAADIQKTANAFQIDTSVVMLKNLINNIETYKLEIKTALDFAYPTDVTIIHYDSQITAIHLLIDDFQGEINTLQELNKKLNIEITNVSEAQSTVELTNKIQENSERVQYLNSEINTLQTEIQELGKNKLHIKQILLSENAQFNEDINELYDEIEKSSTASIQTEIPLQEQLLSEPQKHIEEVIVSAHIPNSINYTNDEIVETFVSEDDKTQVEQAAVPSIDNQNTEIEELVANQAKNAIKTETDKQLIINDSTIAYMDTEHKEQLFNDILSSDTLVLQKTMDLYDFFTAENKFALQKKDALQTIISEKINKIEISEKNISEIDVLLQNKSLHPFDKKRLETQWTVNMNILQTTLAEYVELRKLEKIFEKEIEANEQILEDIAHYYPIVEKAVHNNKLKAAENNFNKLTKLIKQSENELFADKQTIEENINNSIYSLNEQNAINNVKLIEYEKKKGEANIQLAEQQKKLQQNSNPKQESKISTQIDKLEAEIKTYTDAISYTQQKIQDNKKEITYINSLTPQIINTNETITQIAQQNIQNQISHIEIPAQTIQKKQRIDAITQTSPLSYEFTEHIAKLNHWKYSPETDKTDENIQLVSQRSKSDNIYISSQVLDEKELNRKVDIYTIQSLQTYSIAYLANIQNLEKQIKNIQNPELLYNAISELQTLKSEYLELISLHNKIASQYAMPLIDEDNSIITIPTEQSAEYMQQIYTEQFLLHLTDSLTQLYRNFQIAEIDEKPEIQEQMYAIEQKIELINFEILQTQIFSKKAEQLAIKTVLNQIPQDKIPIIPIEDINIISELEKEISQLQNNINSLQKKLTDASSISAKKPIMLKMYEYQEEISQKQNIITNLYKNYTVIESHKFDSIYGQIVENTIKNQEQVAQTYTDSSSNSNIPIKPIIEPKTAQNTLIEENIAINIEDEKTHITPEPILVDTLSEQIVETINIDNIEEQSEQVDAILAETEQNSDKQTNTIITQVEIETINKTEDIILDKVIENSEQKPEFTLISEDITKNEDSKQNQVEAIINKFENNINLQTNKSPIIDEELSKITIETNTGSPDYKSFYDVSNPIPENAISQGLIFKVQISASRSLLSNNTFQGLSPIVYEFADNWYRYMLGEFRDLNNAISVRNQVRTTTVYSDAFVVAYYNGKRISIAEARNIIRTETTPLASTEATPTHQTSSLSDDIIEFTTLEGIIYTVQVGVFGSPRNSNQLYGYKPLIQDSMKNGNYRYMIGLYENYSQAIEVRDEIRRTSVPDAFVVVYRNGSRISNTEAQNYISEGEKISKFTDLSKISTTKSQEKELSIRAEQIFISVQLGAFSNQVPVEVVNSFIRISETGIDFFQNQEGYTIYTAGKFKSIEEAEELKQKIQASGIPDAFIIATENGKKISIEEAIRIISSK